MADTFTGWLRERSEPDWTAVITHPFTRALFDGLVPTESMRSYLVQDYQFVDDFLALLGSALAKADRYASRLAIAGSIAVVTSEENTYFQRAFDALGVGEADRGSHPLAEHGLRGPDRVGDRGAGGQTDLRRAGSDLHAHRLQTLPPQPELERARPVKCCTTGSGATTSRAHPAEHRRRRRVINDAHPPTSRTSPGLPTRP